ncbi:hypothetical protein PIIN_09169 [Serendipita indica DSM 11827]|uniref:Uncharacterized protein n=1 Tax=Serendipita indica (strain DSM 11827) TaxID=1109443 RepID=G4TV42_SERID|nr:hypothetical protein PIIN_09169 [Serendipita indica DSM 11827]
MRALTVVAVFTLRLYALYSNIPRIRNYLTYFIITVQLILTCLGTVTAVITSQNVIWVEPMNICINNNPPMRIYSLAYGSLLAIEIPIFLANLYHAIRFRRQCPSLKGTAPGIIIRTLHKDGFTYFAVIFTARLVICALIWSSVSFTALLLTYLELAVMSTLTSRWILSFRQVLVGFWDDVPASEPRADLTSDLPMTTLDFTNETLEILRETEEEETHSERTDNRGT